MDTSERLRYEAIRQDHAAALFSALAHPDVGRYIGGPEAADVEALAARIGRQLAGPPSERAAHGERWINFVVLRPNDDTDGGTLIGRVEATTYGDWAEIAYLFGREHWGQGYGAEATRWLIDHLATDLGITELWASIHHENERSIRLAEAVGLVAWPTAPGPRPVASYDPGDVLYRLG